MTSVRAASTRQWIVTAIAGTSAAALVVSGAAVSPASAAGDVLSSDLTQAADGPAPTKRAVGTERIHFYWGLKRDDKGVASALKKASNPKSPGYRQFLSPKQVAAQYGATDETVKSVKKYLKKRGVTPKLDASRAFIRLKGTVSQLEQAFGVPIESEAAPGAAYEVFAVTSQPSVPQRIKDLAPQRVWAYSKQTQFGTGSSKPASRASSVKPNGPGKRIAPAAPTNQGTFIGTCSELSSSDLAAYIMTVQQAAKAYKLSSLQLLNRGDSGGYRGKQPLIGVLALGSGYTDSALQQAADCAGVRATAQRYHTDGVGGPLVSGLEGNLDIQMVLSVTQGISKVPVFEGTESGITTFTGPFAALSSPHRPTVLTNSYGQCEPETAPQVRKLTDSAYGRLALTGTSTFVAAGDSGSSACVNHDTEIGPTDLAVGYPASSPFTVGVGGTRLTLTPQNTIADEVVWNDSEWGVLAGGNGGTSSAYSRPWWQPKSVTHAGKLAVPDLSAHASTFPGFPVVGISPTFFAEPVYGTSAAAPLTAAGFALINAREINRGRPPLGFVNPWLYQQRYKVIRDVKRGNNAVFNPACCQAKSGFDQASGLGSPNFKHLAKNISPPH